MSFKHLAKVPMLLVTFTAMQPAVAQIAPASISASAPVGFVRGPVTLFEDDMRSDQIGTIPPKWNLIAGGNFGGMYLSLATIKELNGYKALVLTQGNGGGFEPMLPGGMYLPDSFTVEYDVFQDVHTCSTGCYTGLIFGDDSLQDWRRIISIGIWTDGRITGNCAYYDSSAGQRKYFGIDGRYKGKYDPSLWHHMDFAFGKGRIAFYIDGQAFLYAGKYFSPKRLMFDGRAVFGIKNVRVGMSGKAVVRSREKEPTLVLEGMLFDVNKSIVKAEDYGKIKELADWMKKHPATKVRIGGHTDDEGTEAANAKLAVARAEAVKRLLYARGVRADRIYVKGYGASAPVDKRNTPEAKANNRRVVFEVVE